MVSVCFVLFCYCVRPLIITPVLSLSRIFGCLARWECVKVKEAFDRGGYKRTLEVAIKTTLKGVPSLHMIVSFTC